MGPRGVLDRFALSPNVVLETTVAGRRFEIEVRPDGQAPMTIAPQSESGSYFNTQERHVRSLQWVEAISLIRNWRGEHVVKTGADVQWARFEGTSENRPVEVRRLDGSLAERTVFGGPTSQESPGPKSRSSARIAGASVRGSRWSWGSAWIAIRSSNT